MFGCQLFLEVFYSLKAHKIRTVFTGFGVMWAMLILVLLQGAGTGFHNGIMKTFRSYSIPCMRIYGGYGLTGDIHLTEALTDDLATSLNVFGQVMPVFKKECSVVYAQALHKSAILGVRVGYEEINDLALVEGRFFNERDLAARLPVCILGLQMKKQIFDTKTAVGRFIIIDGVMVCVVGVLDETTWLNNASIMIPSSLFKALFPRDAKSINRIVCTLAPKQNAIEVAETVRAYLARQLNFEAEDKHALWIHGPSQSVSRFEVLFVVMKGFVWLVSFCFLVSGVVGVGNMMLVVVKERTQELAIRRVMGAKSSDIMGLILLESIVINLISGILGLGIGISMLQWMNTYLVPIFEKYGVAPCAFQFSMVLSALVVLVLSGCLAGMIPAKRALYIKPVNALNNE